MQSTRLLISPLENDYATNKIVIKYTKVRIKMIVRYKALSYLFLIIIIRYIT